MKVARKNKGQNQEVHRNRTKKTTVRFNTAKIMIRLYKDILRQLGITRQINQGLSTEKMNTIEYPTNDRKEAELGFEPKHEHMAL